MRLSLLLVAFALGALLDLVVSVLGMALIFQATGMFAYLVCIAIAFASVCLRLCTHPVLEGKGTLYRWLSSALWISIFLDGWAAINAVVVHIIGRQPLGKIPSTQWTDMFSTFSPQFFFAAVLVAFFVLSPIGVSFLWKAYRHGELDEGGESTIESRETRERAAESVEPSVPPKIR